MSDTDMVVLSSKEDILDRLYNIAPDPYLHERFYPLIAQSAGRELVAEGIVMMFGLKIYDFMHNGGEYPPIIEFTLSRLVPRFIDALVDDKAVAERAKSIWETAQKRQSS